MLATPVRVQVGLGRRDKATLLDDDPTEFWRFIARMYWHAPEMAEKNETLDAFCRSVQSGLQDLRIGDSHMLYVPNRDASGASPLTFHLLFHTGAVFASVAVKATYEIEHAARLRQLEQEQETEEAVVPRTC